VKLKVTPSTVSGIVTAPPSKSYSHRAVILGSLARGETVIENLLFSDDTGYTINACRSLGVDIERYGQSLRIKGTSGNLLVRPGHNTIFAGNSGSTLRMLLPLAALADGKIIFDGSIRLRERPVTEILAALASLGVKTSSIDKNGRLPVEVQGGRLYGGEVLTSGLAGSQHVSSLLMIAPYARSGIKIKITDSLRSKPYVDMTVEAMRRFGVEVERRNHDEFTVTSGQRYQGQHYEIEGDYSSAAFFFALGAIGGKEVTVANLNGDSLQGDRYFLELMSLMGCYVNHSPGQISVRREGELTGITADMGDYPDIVQPLAAVAAFARGTTNISNISHLKGKETDRIINTAAELGKMGITVKVTENSMSITGGRPRGAKVDAHDDHRLAMSLAIAGLFAGDETVINGAGTVNKSYPDFFTDLASIGAKLEPV